MTYCFCLGMLERWGGQKRICEEMSPPLLAAETDNMPPTIIISEDKDELRIRPSFIQSREECSI